MENYLMGIVIAFIALILIILIVVMIKASAKENDKLNQMSDQERNDYKNKQRESFWHGEISDQMICPHCQTKGSVHTQQTKQKNGISGAKATGAIITGGISLLATGLSRKENVTEAYCNNCKQSWHF